MPKRRSPWDALTRVVSRLTPGEIKAFRAVAVRPMAVVAYIRAKAKRHEGYSEIELEALKREITETVEPFLRFLAKHGITLVPTKQKPTRRGRTARRKTQ